VRLTVTSHYPGVRTDSYFTGVADVDVLYMMTTTKV